MSIFNKLQFDDIDSLRNGVYITGEAVYNSPERDVELIEIPGRNGDLVLDKKRFKNIEVKYKAGAKGQTKDDFSNVMRSFRSLLASKRGYKRLTDTYNPDEFRLGTFIDAIEVDPSERKKAGEFDLVFNCKPQRFLMSGEAAVEVTDGEEFFNPTPFEASPLIMAEGYGTLTVNGYEIKIADDLVGTVRVKNAFSDKSASWVKAMLPDVYALPGDDITVGDNNSPFCTMFIVDVNGYDFVDADINNIAGDSTINPIADFTPDPKICRIDIPIELSSLPMTFNYGTANEYGEAFDITLENSNGDTKTYHIEFTVSYDGANKILFQWTGAPSDLVFTYTKDTAISCGNIDLISTATTFGHPTYIDCDLGEAYAKNGDNIESLNRFIDLGSDLPVLAPGVNLIEYDNTFTSIQIVPRWWLL